MAEAAPRLDWPAVSAAVLQALRENVERLNAADRWNHNHGDHMLELGQQLDAAVQAAPESAPPELLARMDEVLAGLQPNGGLQAYRELLARSRAAWLAGEVDESRLIAVARRLVHGEASAADESQRLAGTLGGLLRSLGGAGRARRLADRFGVGELLDGGLGLAAGAQGALLQASTAYLVSLTNLASVPHRAESGRLVLRTLLLEVDRQAGGGPTTR